MGSSVAKSAYDQDNLCSLRSSHATSASPPEHREGSNNLLSRKRHQDAETIVAWIQVFAYQPAAKQTSGPRRAGPNAQAKVLEKLKACQSEIRHQDQPCESCSE